MNVLKFVWRVRKTNYFLYERKIKYNMYAIYP